MMRPIGRSAVRRTRIIRFLRCSSEPKVSIVDGELSHEQAHAVGDEPCVYGYRLQDDETGEEYGAMSTRCGGPMWPREKWVCRCSP